MEKKPEDMSISRRDGGHKAMNKRGEGEGHTLKHGDKYCDLLMVDIQ